MWGRGRCWLWRQTMTLVKVDRIWHNVCIMCMRLIVEYFFLSRHFIFGGFSYKRVLLHTVKYGTMPIYLCRCKRFLQNTGKCIPDHNAIHPWRQQSSGIYKFVLLLSLFTFNYLITFVAYVIKDCPDCFVTSLNLFIFLFKFKSQLWHSQLQFWQVTEKIK